MNYRCSSSRLNRLKSSESNFAAYDATFSEWYNEGVKTDLNTTGYLPSKPLASRAQASKDVVPKLAPTRLPAKGSPDYKLDLSGNTKPGASAPSLPSLPLPPTPSIPSVPQIDADIPSPVSEAVEAKANAVAKKEMEKIVRDEVKPGSVRKPLVIFIKGLDLFSSPSKSEGGYAGVGRIAQSIEGSRTFGWDQKDEIATEVAKIHRDFPVVLVGHSLGGDTAVEIADEFDSLKQGFRPIDLLVTIDAVGFSNDIIPQNVKQHLNIFGETSLFLNDGPHVARREEKTNVRNILSPLDHTEIDDDREVQFEVVDLIQQTLASRP